MVVRGFFLPSSHLPVSVARGNPPIGGRNPVKLLDADGTACAGPGADPHAHPSHVHQGEHVATQTRGVIPLFSSHFRPTNTPAHCLTLHTHTNTHPLSLSLSLKYGFRPRRESGEADSMDAQVGHGRRSVLPPPFPFPNHLCACRSRRLQGRLSSSWRGRHHRFCIASGSMWRRIWPTSSWQKASWPLAISGRQWRTTALSWISFCSRCC